MRALDLIRAPADRIERSPIGIAEFAASLAAIIAVRHLLEMATARYPVYSPLQLLVHYPLAYIAPMLALTLLLSLFSGERIERVARLMLFAWLLTLLPPLADLLLARPHTQQIGYLVDGREGFFRLLARFFDPRLELPGTTRGIRIETALACLLGGSYVLLKGRGWPRALACAAALLPACLFFFTLPARFVDAARWVLGPVSTEAILGQRGRLRSIQDADVADMIIVCYLVPLVLALLALFLQRHARGLSSAPLRLACGPSHVVAAGAAAVGAIGAAAGTQIRSAVAAEPIAIAGAALAALLCSSCLGASGEEGEAAARHPDARRASSVGLLALGIGLAAALGSAPLAMALALLGLRVLATVRPFALEGRPFFREALGGGAALTAGLLGASLFYGREVLVRMPFSLAASLVACGVLVSVATGPGSGPVRALRSVALALAPIGFPIVLGEPWLALPAALFGAAGALLLSASFAMPTFGQAARAVAVAAALAGGWLAVRNPGVASSLHADSLRSPHYHVRAAEEARKAGDLESAAELYRGALERDPRFFTALMGLGQVALQRQEMETAIVMFRQAAEVDPSSSAACNGVGAALLASGRTAEALQEFEAALQRDPLNCLARYNHAAARDRLSQGRDARGGWQEYLDLCADRPSETESARLARRRLDELSPGAPAPPAGP